MAKKSPESSFPRPRRRPIDSDNWGCPCVGEHRRPSADASESGSPRQHHPCGRAAAVNKERARLGDSSCSRGNAIVRTSPQANINLWSIRSSVETGLGAKHGAQGLPVPFARSAPAKRGSGRPRFFGRLISLSFSLSFFCCCIFLCMVGHCSL